jgi:formylglycine-generating enzyme required for sulfatase activity
MVQMFIPAGSFEMGSEDGDSDERPVHTVSLDAYWMDQTEVTNAMFVAFLNEQGNQSEGGATWLDDSDSDVLIVQSGGSWVPKSGYADHPVVEVTWYGAQAYCDWAGRRMPTEAEWEKAARGGLERARYPWGEDDPICTPGARNGAQFGSCNGQTVSVMTFAPNGYGLFDMAGNVWEWVNDWYDVYPGGDPGASNSFGNTYRVLRGGSWYVVTSSCAPPTA